VTFCCWGTLGKVSVEVMDKMWVRGDLTDRHYNRTGHVAAVQFSSPCQFSPFLSLPRQLPFAPSHIIRPQSAARKTNVAAAQGRAASTDRPNRTLKFLTKSAA